MEKTNILIIAPGLNIGGLEMVIAHLCRNIDKEKFNISVCCLKQIGSIGNELIKEGYSVTALKKPRYLKNNYISWLQLIALIKNNNIHVLHSHTLDSLLDASLCKLFLRKIRVIHTFHFGNYPHLPQKYLFIEKLFWRFADQLVAVGDEQKEKIIKTLKINSHSIVTVWNGVPKFQDIHALSSIVEKYRYSGRIIIGTVCTLIEQKGLTDLLDVAHLLKRQGRKAIFLIAGEGDLRQDLEEKISRLGLNKDVILLGWVDSAATTFIPYIDIFFLPSLWEAMSVVVLEAMEAGKPVVVTNVGENRRVIKDGVDGFVVKPRDTQEMLKTLDRLVVDSQLRERVGGVAQVKVRTHFSVEMMVLAYQNLYIE